jgi:hypothetical protein
MNCHAERGRVPESKNPQPRESCKVLPPIPREVLSLNLVTQARDARAVILLHELSFSFMNCHLE